MPKNKSHSGASKRFKVTGKDTLSVVHDFNFLFSDNVARTVHHDPGDVQAAASANTWLIQHAILITEAHARAYASYGFKLHMAAGRQKWKPFINLMLDMLT